MQPTFGEMLFSLRRVQRLLQKDVAQAVGIDQSYLASLEKGPARPAKPEACKWSVIL